MTRSMLTFTDLTDQELSEVPPAVRRVVAQLDRRTTGTVAALMSAKPNLTREHAERQASERVMRWAQEHVDPRLMHRVVVYVTAFEVLREHIAAGSLVRIVTADGAVIYAHPDQLEDTHAR